MDSHIQKIVASIPAAPKNKNTITPNEIIESGIYTEEELMQAIEELLVNGQSYRYICETYKISLTALSRWLSHTQRIARTIIATKISADYYADMSIQVLKDAPGDKVEIMRAKELSSAYRWIARVRDVNKYGEKLDVTSDNKPIIQVNLGSGIKPPELEKYIDITPQIENTGENIDNNGN
jgi:hypothetical protein